MCPNCGGSHLNRLTEARIKLELDALAYLHASTGEPSDAQRVQLANRMKTDHQRAAQQDADAEEKRDTRNTVAQGELFP